ncbi:MAG: hypothetical protein O7A66_02280, partial [Alphaproteobacteria bacterium]|nr:hypothetical protein [Alphaproteobacteria bacterium]
MSNGNIALNSAAVRCKQHANKLILVGALGTFVLFFSAFDAAAETKIIFGAYSSDKPSAMVAQVQPTLNAISKKIAEMYGEKVTFRMQV